MLENSSKASFVTVWLADGIYYGEIKGVATD